MSSQSRVPGFGTIARAQIILLVQTMYVVAAIGVPLLGLLAVHAFKEDPSIHLIPWAIPPILNRAYPIVVTYALCAAYLTWFGEPPSKRRYHWSMPVPRALHDGMRVLAGAFWLCLGIAAFCVVGTLVEDPVLRSRWLGDAGMFYASLFMVSLLIYLLFSIFAIAFDRSALWIGGVVLAALLLTTGTVQKRVPLAADLQLALLNPLTPYSLGAATVGSFMYFPWWDARKQQIVAASTIDEYTTAQGIGPGAQRLMKAEIGASFARQLETDRRVRERVKWIPSLTLWYVISLLGLALALRRRPDV